jgi:twitching motility two-component system response regulator PilH
LPDNDHPYAAFNLFFGAHMARVLIIDDSPTETYKLTSMLEKNGHVVLTADNGEAGIALAQKELPDVVLMDVVMPGLNGFQATRQLSKMPETAHIPVIIVTTKDQQTDRVWGMRQGAKAYLAKPITQEVLMSAMAEVMR